MDTGEQQPTTTGHPQQVEAKLRPLHEEDLLSPLSWKKKSDLLLFRAELGRLATSSAEKVGL